MLPHVPFGEGERLRDMVCERGGYAKDGFSRMWRVQDLATEVEKNARRPAREKM